jgi:hypothetical protein
MARRKTRADRLSEEIAQGEKHYGAMLGVAAVILKSYRKGEIGDADLRRLFDQYLASPDAGSTEVFSLAGDLLVGKEGAPEEFMQQILVDAYADSPLLLVWTMTHEMLNSALQRWSVDRLSRKMFFGPQYNPEAPVAFLVALGMRERDARAQMTSGRAQLLHMKLREFVPWGEIGRERPGVEGAAFVLGAIRSAWQHMPGPMPDSDNPWRRIL